jgi:hypothetical protein
VKRSTTRPSTTATPYSHKFTFGPRGFIAILASSTVVTFPTAAALLHHQGLAVTLLVGLLPIMPLILVTAVFVVGYVAAAMLATLVVMADILRGSSGLDTSFDDLFVRITNAPISFLTLTPLKFPVRSARRTSSPSPLPPGAPGSTREQDTKIYWEVFRDMMAARPDGVPDIVSSGDRITQTVRGRHEKPETEPRAESRDRAPALSS